MTHLEMLKHIIETDPWEIAHRLWTCMDCPKLEECNVMMSTFSLNKTFFMKRTEEICRTCLTEWLNEEVSE